MSENPGIKPVSEIEMDKNNLYKEEIFTDLRVGTIQVFTPVKADGSPDPSRVAFYSGEAQIMGPGGPLPIRTKLEAKTLEEALAKFPAAIDAAIKDVVEQIRELQRQEMSRIVTPDEVAASLVGGGGGGLGGGLGGGRPGRPSKIVLK